VQRIFWKEAQIFSMESLLSIVMNNLILNFFIFNYYNVICVANITETDLLVPFIFIYDGY